MVLTTRQHQIIETALQLTSAGGIQNLTIKNVSSRLGITEPAIYRHFASKSEIVKAMIESFDRGVAVDATLTGYAGIAAFARSRFAQIASNPSLAKVMFAEELFMDDPDYSALLVRMMHRHKQALQKHFDEAIAAGEIRSDIEQDMLFRIVFGSVRLLVKQWGMSSQGFDLQAKGEELLEALRKILGRPICVKPN
ncbi:MAG: TetR family transcriptional regulator [Lentisphaeria bacterium]|jgi:AcrR family transcriptional regulator|nr:TetR family transcriptional regulator [Lentisphaeria bacterium]